MFCPSCQMQKKRGKWSDAQWVRKEPRFDSMNGCKDCRAPIGPCAPDLDLAETILALYKESLPKEEAVRVITVFIAHHWLPKLSPDYRKRLSHLGAVTCNDVVHPRYWRYADRTPVFDPGALAPGSVIFCTSMLPCEFRMSRMKSGTVPEALYKPAPATSVILSSEIRYPRVWWDVQH